MNAIKIEYTDKEITPWGGMVLMSKMLSQINFKEVIKQCPYLPLPGSNRGYSPTEIIEPFMVSVWCGANRFLHTEITRHDNPLAKIFGWKSAPGNDAYKRYFGKFTQGINERVFDYFSKWYFRELKFDRYTIDFDSSVLTRYGNQEGAKKGYNPQKHGRASHHPLMAFIADCNMVANFWLRSGNSNASNNFAAFLEQTIDRLEGKKVSLVRLDSGFYDKAVFELLESKHLPYVVAVKFHESIQKILATERIWLKLDQGVEISETMYQSPLWDKPRRMIMVRQEIKFRPKATGKTLKLFKDEGIYKQYRYSSYITSLDFSMADVWRLYRLRGDAENRIKELKYDFGFDSFNMNNFFGTEAALSFVMLAYNLMSLFKQFIVNSSTQQRLSTLRFRTFAIGAYFVKNGRDIILKLALSLKRREWFTGLWNKTQQFSLPVFYSNA
jgi:hypothetical protein